MLAALEEEVQEAEMVQTLAQELMVVMAEQEVMVEVEGVAVLLLRIGAALVAMAPLVALD